MRFFNRTFLALSAAAAFSAASLMAQGPGGPGHFGGRGLNFLATALDLTESQQTQAKSIFSAEQASAKPVETQLRSQRQAVQAAIVAGKSADEVSALATQEGSLLGQLEGIRASAQQQFYSILNPTQQKKFAALHQHGTMGSAPAP